MSRRRARKGPPRCKQCQSLITFFRSPEDSWWPFWPRPVDGHLWVGERAYPISSGRAWRFEDLVEHVMAQTQCGRAEAEDDVYARPWYVAHRCTTTTLEEPQK